jgi:hypothetical protein
VCCALCAMLLRLAQLYSLPPASKHVGQGNVSGKCWRLLTVSMTSLVPLMSCLPKFARELPTAPKGCCAAPAAVLLLLPPALVPSAPEASSPVCRDEARGGSRAQVGSMQRAHRFRQYQAWLKCTACVSACPWLGPTCVPLETVSR